MFNELRLIKFPSSDLDNFRMKEKNSNSLSSTELIYLEMREEIMQHKWVESQKAGIDIGFENASKDWEMKHSENWFKSNEPKFEKYI